MTAPFPNQYTHRKVADASAKSCDICYKLSTSVLITPDNKDFFYVCPIHLKDVNFCTPRIDEDAVKARREKELAEETKKLKKEYEERQHRKKENESKDNESKEKEKKDTKDQKEDNGKGEDEERDEAVAAPQEQEPRVFELKSAFYKQRIQRKRHTEVAKRDRERASQPNYFPSVPTDLPRK
ncbi:hypothetical protein G6O67_004542 [Ophiocordyceps sinensis]|uniref:DUF1742-domain-containing protein n=2 Tax=Ophiocordyceps sinensis TaxID=72228 RepID=A0A8H4PPM2_9HYPO|nr:hypothetical protein OCS_06388 [Ophiocordyceps sinensis CO18]KAF4508121.1 hypothetical protein G6O67_004542 [Ophiocordyceps sinensis]